MITRKLTCFLLVTTLFSGMLWAQSKDQDQQRAKLGGAPGTERIIREARHELLLLPYYTLFDWLAFKVDGNTVTLLGQVTNGSLKKDAENAVKKVEGVERVQNEIELLPASPFDDRIRRAEYRTIYGFAGLYRYAIGSSPSIHIIVKNGHVTLRGVVDSEADKNEAGIQARTVPGVFDVNNELEVAGGNSPK
jgi:hyperosmotically inducible protein